MLSFANGRGYDRSLDVALPLGTEPVQASDASNDVEVQPMTTAMLGIVMGIGVVERRNRNLNAMSRSMSHYASRAGRYPISHAVKRIWSSASFNYPHWPWWSTTALALTSTCGRRKAAGPPLSMWVVYDRPKDYPDGYIARRHEAHPGYSLPTGDTMTSETLDGLRAKLAPGRARFPREPNDDPVIVETWV